VHVEVRAIDEQVVQLKVVEAAGAPGVELAWQTRETVDLDSAARGPNASAREASTSRTDSPRTNPAITNVSNAFVFDTPVLDSFGRSRVTGPAVVFTVVGQYPLREPGHASGASVRRR
jgi:hypothetical protein